MTVLAEHLHHLDKLVTNDEFPPKVFDGLRKTEIHLCDNELVIKVPELPIEAIGKGVDGYSIWINAKYSSLLDYEINWHQVDRSERISEMKKKTFTFRFDVPPKVE